MNKCIYYTGCFKKYLQNDMVNQSYNREQKSHRNPGSLSVNQFKETFISDTNLIGILSYHNLHNFV